MTIGVCYFPEHWPRERWPTDFDQMAEADLGVVRMGEFAWSRLEPAPGRLELDWLETAVDLAHERGLETVLCTPTATPPKWLVDAHPDIRQVDRDGTVRTFGSRRHYCFNSPTYRQETARIVTRLADRFAGHPGVVGWQTDNEYGCHETVRCFCADCAGAFRDWLRARYDDIDALNEAWGTTFWSQHHTDFAEIDPPGPTPAEHHPARRLAYARFASDSVVSYNALQTAILGAATDDWTLTHNFMGGFGALDAFAVRTDLDVAAWDAYPTGFAQFRAEPAPWQLRAGDPDQLGLSHDLYRGPGGLWVMELQPGDINWAPHAPQPADGAIALWAHHAVGHGADTVLYFRWRRCLEGQEQYHAGLRKRDGSPDRGYRAAASVAADLADLDPDPVSPPVAILHEYENLWALDAQPHGVDFDYWAHLGVYYRALRARGVAVDVVHPRADLDGYRAVVAPTLYLADADRAAALADYVTGGGRLLLTMRSGMKDRDNKLHPEAAPGPFAGLVGTTVDRWESLPRSLDPAVTLDDQSYPYRTWAEWLDPDDATPVATHTTGVAAGSTAVTRVERGAGVAWYVGVWPRRALAATLVEELLASAAVPRCPPLPAGVRFSQRGGLTWVTNFSDAPVTIHGTSAGSWLHGDATLDPYDLGIVAAAPAELRATRA